MHRTPQNRRGCIKRSDSRSAGRKWILTWNSHLRSFKLIHRPTRSSISPYNIAGLISEISEEVASKIAKKCCRRQSHSYLTPPPRGTLYFQKLESLTYISLADSMGLSSFKFVQWASKDPSFMQQSAFSPFKFIQGRWFWYQSNARMRLPISPSSWLWSYITPFLRYGDLLPKNRLFFLSLSHSAPSLPMFPLEFRGEVNHEETRVMGLSYSEDPVIVAWVVLAWYQRVTDGQTVSKTVGQIYDS